jgi:hypothetical protein
MTDRPTRIKEESGDQSRAREQQPSSGRTPGKSRNPRWRSRRDLQEVEPVAADVRILRALRVEHQIELPEIASAADVVLRIQDEVKTLISRQQDGRIVFRLPNVPKDVRVTVEFSGLTDPESANKALNAVAPFAISSVVFPAEGLGVKSQRGFVLDSTNVDALGDLRDETTGGVDARKVRDLFGVSMPSIAKAAGISRQALNGNPQSEKAQSILKLFERVARLRSHPQFRRPSDLRKWFRRSYPIFSNHSAEDLFKAGKLDVVATKVDEMLTGDFGG